MIKYFCKNCNINIESSECSICGARTEVESKLYWCSACNIPIYDEVCPICGTKGVYFTSDARPVFPEERLLIEVMLGKPFCFIKDSVWNGSGNRYYINGKRIPFSVTNLKNYNPDSIRQKLDELKEQNTYTHFDRMIIIPVAYYLYKSQKRLCDLNESDKNTIRKFLITGMVKKIFSSSVESGLSNILGKLKQTNLNGDIELRCSDHFDFDSLKTLEFQERTLRVEEADVDEIINFKKGPLTFMILSLLYPDLKLSEIKWHQDHIHPRYAFDKNRLIKYFAEKGMKLDDNTLKAWAANSNTLVNLQLLTGKQNQEKSKTPLVTWIYNQFPDDDKRKKYCEEHYIDFDAGFELENFDAYYNRRREKLKKKLMEIFSVQVISEEETRIIEEQTSEEESVITPEGKTIAEAAVSVLIDHPEGLTCKQIYEAIMEQHLYEFKAEKPEVVLRIEIRRRCQNVDISKSYETKWFRIVKKVDGECYYGITFSD